MKILSAVRHSGKSYHSKLLNFVDCDKIIGEAIGCPLHFDKKEFSDKIYSSPIIDEHDVNSVFT